MKQQKMIYSFLSTFLITALLPILALSQNKTHLVFENLPQFVTKSDEEIRSKIQKKPEFDVDPKKKNSDPFVNNHGSKPIDFKFQLKSKTLQGGTGVDGGGGNTKSSKPITFAELEEFIFPAAGISNNLLSTVEMVFNILSAPPGHALADYGNEYTQEGRPAISKEHFESLKKINRKLFYSKYTIYDALKNASILLQKAPCVDPITNLKKDGSAQISTQTICLSSDELLSKLNEDDYISKLVMLLIHEYSHLVGTTEDEAEIIEQTIEEMGGLSNDITNQFAKFLMQYEHNFMNLFRKFENSLNRIETISQASACAIAYQGLKEVTALDKAYVNLELQNLSLLNSRESSDFNDVLTYRMYNLLRTCDESIIDFISKSDEADFFITNLSGLFKHDQDQITLEEAIKVFFGNDMISYVEYPKGKLQNTKKDLKFVRLEMAEIYTQLSYLKSRFNHLSYGLKTKRKSEK